LNSGAFVLAAGLSAGSIIVLVIIGVAILSLPTICALKGKWGFALAGVIIHVLWYVGAIRLAKPASWWARRFYSPYKLGEAARRFPDAKGSAQALAALQPSIPAAETTMLGVNRRAQPASRRGIASMETAPVVADGGEPQMPANDAGGRRRMVVTKACPECAERVRAEARKCRFCGFRFDTQADAVTE